MQKNIDYIVVEELPAEQQAPFMNWLQGQTISVIPAEADKAFKCCEKSKYDLWLSFWMQGKQAPEDDD